MHLKDNKLTLKSLAAVKLRRKLLHQSNSAVGVERESLVSQHIESKDEAVNR